MEWLCELILTSLQASNQSSGNARRQSVNWKLLIWCGRLSAWICLDLQKQHHMHSACCIPASGREERDILDHAKLVCTFTQPLQMLSPKALCKCMSVLHKRWYARLPASPRAAWSSSGSLSSTNFATQTPATWACDLPSLPFVSAQLSQTGSLF